MEDNLKYRYNEIISEYLARFTEKQGLELDPDSMQSDFFWFNEGNWTFPISDIRLDIDLNVPAGQIKQWFSECSSVFKKKGVRINYRSWLMGAR